MSALEHVIPERFFNDPAKCNPEGTTTPTAGLPACPQGISAVKAIGLAAAQGQKIYTITQDIYRANPNIVSTNLSNLSFSTRQGIQNALDAGNEVTTHEAPITQSGWTGSGYIFIDPNTGAGGYIIDGGSNGAVLLLFFISVLTIPLQFVLLSTGLLIAATAAGFAGFIATVLLVMVNSDLINPTLLALLRFFVVFGLFVSIPLSSAPAGAAALVGLILATLGAIAGIFRGALS